MEFLFQLDAEILSLFLCIFAESRIFSFVAFEAALFSCEEKFFNEFCELIFAHTHLQRFFVRWVCWFLRSFEDHDRFSRGKRGAWWAGLVTAMLNLRRFREFRKKNFAKNFKGRQQFQPWMLHIIAKPPPRVGKMNNFQLIVQDSNCELFIRPPLSRNGYLSCLDRPHPIVRSKIHW